MSSEHTAGRVRATATAGATADTTSIPTRIVAGVAGGLAGGAAFGMLMALMGMLPMIASLVGSTSAVVGLVVHLVISVLIGLTLTIPGAGLLKKNLMTSAAIGAVYGMLWWVLGPLMIMPAMIGMPTFTLDAASIPSLVGHVLYGLILGPVAAMVIRRRR